MSATNDQPPTDPQSTVVLTISEGLQRLEDTVPHSLLLSALLHAYTALAVRHRCCTQGASSACFSTALRLAQTAQLAPQDQPLH